MDEATEATAATEAEDHSRRPTAGRTRLVLSPTEHGRGLGNTRARSSRWGPDGRQPGASDRGDAGPRAGGSRGAVDGQRGARHTESGPATRPTHQVAAPPEMTAWGDPGTRIAPQTWAPARPSHGSEGAPPALPRWPDLPQRAAVSADPALIIALATSRLRRSQQLAAEQAAR